jgi:DNA primase
MAKISPTSIKYNITADFAAEGPLEKPDVIGALFGQTEGLLGSDMELRELQKEGKIGRIEVEVTSEGGKTNGEIIIPSALDKTETTIIAAAIETIDKIGPTDANVTIKEIEDVRGSKRDYIMERAKKLLANISGQGPEVQEIGEELKESARTSKITEYGAERLPAGDISGNEVIVVEGRADVINLLKHAIKNVIGMQGTKLPAEISKLGEEKELTLFVDGDRGGKLIAKNVCDNAKIKYIANAPDGKEVEELTGKEIHQALRKKVKPEEFLRYAGSSYGSSRSSASSTSSTSSETKKPMSDKKLTAADKAKLRDMADQIKGKNVLVLNDNLDVIRDVPVSKLMYLRLHESIPVLMTSTATNSVAQGAEKLGAKYIAAKNFGKIDSKEVELISI